MPTLSDHRQIHVYICLWEKTWIVMHRYYYDFESLNYSVFAIQFVTNVAIFILTMSLNTLCHPSILYINNCY